MITLPIEKDLLKEALNTWGKESQIMCAVEECSEFITASSHLFRGRENNIEEEIADSIIMLLQMRELFDKSKIDIIMIQKQERMKMRLAKHNKD
jgi:NTP pyrophosphatase (non-canonical NTP hydrolase)